jgi:hypothetical protein
LGIRTAKPGTSRWFVGYKKHTLRLWLPQHHESVLLVPLMSWVAPANIGDVLFLEPTLRYVLGHVEFAPSFVVGDKAYINLETQRRLRERMRIGVITRLPANYDLQKKIEPALRLQCAQGQKLQWLGLREDEQLHWFGVAPDPEPLCPWCWQQSSCPREFSFAAAEHEIVLGTIPLSTSVARRLLRQSRSWIEAAQSYEKNQLGLDSMFLNGLRLTWVASLMADTVSLLRAHALLRSPMQAPLLHDLMPNQLNLEFK